MKVKNAKEDKKNTKPTSVNDIYKKPPASKNKLKGEVVPLDMFSVEVVSSKSSNNNSGDIDFIISAASESLLKSGFDKLTIIASPDIKQLAVDTKLTLEELDKFFEKQGKPLQDLRFDIDLTESIDKKRLYNLVNNIDENLETTDPEFVFDLTISANEIKEDKFEISEIIFPKSIQDDRLGILELRLGKLSQTFQRESIQEISEYSNLNNPDYVIEKNRENSFSNLQKTTIDNRSVRPESPLQKLLKRKITNSNNKRKPSLITKTQLALAVHTEDQPTNVQIPLIKNFKMEKRQPITAFRRRYNLPGPKSTFSLQIENSKGDIQKKAFPLNVITPLEKNKTYRFISDQYLPKIEIANIGNNTARVTVQNIDNSTERLDIYRREISKKPFLDSYERIASIQNPFNTFSFIDQTESKKVYKYVCVPNRLPLFTYSIYKTPDYEYDSHKEPYAFAYQKDQLVEIYLSKVPDSIRKILVYRKSSIDNSKELINGINVIGRTPSSIKILDKPVPVEQTIEYSIEGIDEDGISTMFADRPEIYYNSKLGIENSNIIALNMKYNQDDHSVIIEGEAKVDNIFIPTSDSELKNPSLTTLEAATRGQQIVKIQIRRINKTMEEDEIIVKEIINPGLSAFNTELASLDRINFSFRDSNESASIFGYTPLRDFCDYIYIARMIVYPLGLELRKVSNYTYIKGERDPGRLAYQFDPAIFDHPLNKELGILPSSPSVKNYLLADIVGQTSGIKVRDIRTFTELNSQNFSLKSTIEVDEDLTPVISLNASFPPSIVDNLDHVEIIMGYDTVKSEDVIDRVFVLNSGSNFKYYDYSFLDLAATSIYYKLVGIGKDFSSIFVSSKSYVNLEDSGLKKAIQRKKSLIKYSTQEEKSLKKSRIINKNEELILRGNNNGK